MSARLGEYELIDRAAVGGVAEIYRARHITSGDVVVIKRVRPDLGFDPEHQAGFERELQLALLAQHKNLIRGLARGSFRGADYGVFEYVDGQDLARIIERARIAKVRIPPQFATFIVGEVLEGLAFAWDIKMPNGQQLGLVHRDLSPRNVFIRYDGEVRVADFGAALASLTEDATEIVGSPGYLSPEQANAKKLDHRSDQFNAALLLFELLAGEPAFDVAKKNDAQVLKMHQKRQMRSIPSNVPAELRAVLERALAEDPNQRYANARAMLEALRATPYPPDPSTKLGIATIVRTLFGKEFKESRIPGAPVSA